MWINDGCFGPHLIDTRYDCIISQHSLVECSGFAYINDCLVLPGVYVACSVALSDVCSLAALNGLVGLAPGIGIETFELVP